MALAKKPRPSRAYFKTTKQMEKLILKAEQELRQETTKQIDIVYHAMAIALGRGYEWGHLRIQRAVDISRDTYKECAESNELSMLQMLYDETGIELMRSDGQQSFKDVIYLNAKADEGKPLSPAQWLAMRQNQKKWVASQITASILIALHRKEGWGVERCGRFFQILEEIKAEYDYDPAALREVSKKETGFYITDDTLNWEENNDRGNIPANQ